MARRGRPRSERAANALIVRIKLRLYPGEDDDLIAFYAGVPDGLRAATTKAALRSGVRAAGEQGQNPDEDLLEALDAFLA